MISQVYAQALGAGDPAKLKDLESVFASVIGYAIPIGGIVLFVMILYGGFQLITAGENPDKVQGAKNTITYAIYGIILISLAYLIIVIIADFTGVEQLKTFRIYTPNP